MKQRAAEHQRLRTDMGPVAAAAAAPAPSETAKSGRSDRQAPLADGGPAGAVPLSLRIHPGVTDSAPIDLRAPELYLNRELTWLAFNRRVLHEAQDPRTPLLERVKFLAIVNAQSRRVLHEADRRPQAAGRRRGQGPDRRRPHARAADRRMRRVRARVHARCPGHLSRAARCPASARHRAVRVGGPEPGAAGSPAQSTISTTSFRWSRRSRWIRRTRFRSSPTCRLNLLVTLYHPDDQYPILARVKVPIGSGVPRFLKVGERNLFVRLEDVMAHNLDLLFPGMEVAVVRVLPGHAQRQHRARRGRGRRPPGDDRGGAQRAPLRADRAARGRARA